MALPESRELLAQMEAVWEEFGDSVEKMESRNFDDSVSGTEWDDFGDMEMEDAAGEVPGDSVAEPGGDFDFLD